MTDPKIRKPTRSPGEMQLTGEQEARLERLLAGSDMGARIGAAAQQIVTRFAPPPEPVEGEDQAARRMRMMEHQIMRGQVYAAIRNAAGD